jgi:cyclophilin family peptidyl-prolyl cis-trans isomerase
MANQEQKEIKLEKKANHFVWIVIVVLAAMFWLLYVWTESSTPSAPANTPVAATSTTVSTAASSTTISVASINQTNQLSNNQHMITITTTKGTIVFDTYDADAPNTVKNFITLANKGFYNGLIFHRVIEGFMIQGGDPTGTGMGGPGYTFADELSPATPSYQAGYVPGTVAMANSGPNTNGSQFFIMQDNVPLPHAYTIFGHVVSGMDVVNAIAAVPTNGNPPAGSNKPLTPVVMEKVTVATTTTTTTE